MENSTRLLISKKVTTGKEEVQLAKGDGGISITRKPFLLHWSWKHNYGKSSQNIWLQRGTVKKMCKQGGGGGGVNQINDQ